MSKYTTELRFICEKLSGLDNSLGYDDVNRIISTARDKIFDFYYPIFDDSYKRVLETKILKHYYTREIGQETYGLWKLKLDTKMNEIMPYYNELYKSALLEFNPLYDVDLTTTHEGEEAGNKTGLNVFNGNKTTNTEDNLNINKGVESAITEDKNKSYEEQNANEGEYTTNVTHEETKDNTYKDNEWNLFSDTPQGGVTGIENAYDGISDNAYLTDARNVKTEGESNDVINYTNATENTHSDNDNKTGSVEEDNTLTKQENIQETNVRNKSETENTENTGNNREDFANTNSWTERIIGKRNGDSYSKLLKEFRETIINIDMMVIEELASLFFLLW